jgi:hypothetical protein
MNAKTARAKMIQHLAAQWRMDQSDDDPAAFDARVKLEVIRRKPGARHSRQRMSAASNTQYRHDDAGGYV